MAQPPQCRPCRMGTPAAEFLTTIWPIWSGSANLAADETEHKLMIVFDQAGRINQICAANRIEDFRDRHPSRRETRRIGRYLKFRNPAALNDDCRHAVQVG